MMMIIKTMMKIDDFCTFDSEIDHISDNDNDIQEDSQLLTDVTEKVMQLLITFITQHFPSDDDLHSPLVHFTDIMRISNRHSRFNKAYNYISHCWPDCWSFIILL